MVDLKELDEVCHKIVESNTKVAPIYDRIVLKVNIIKYYILVIII